MSFGLTSAGLTVKRLSDILVAKQAAIQSVAGANADFSAESVWGAIAGTAAAAEAELWEALAGVWGAQGVRGANGATLDLRMVLANMRRLPARPTVISGVALRGTFNATVAAGAQAQTADTSQVATLQADVVLDGAGHGTGTFVVDTTGPTLVLAGTLTVLPALVPNLTSLTNPVDGVPGANVESDAAFLLRRARAVVAVAASSNPALYSRLIAVTGVVDAVLVNNPFDYVDADGRPAHSFEAVVSDGDDDAIRATIWSHQPAGALAYGTTSGTLADLRGDTQTIHFSRPTTRPAWVTVTAVTRPGFPGAVALRNVLLTYAQTQVGIGQEVDPYPMGLAASGLAGIAELEIAMGFSINTQFARPLVLGRRDLAVFDSTRFAVVIT